VFTGYSNHHVRETLILFNNQAKSSAWQVMKFPFLSNRVGFGASGAGDVSPLQSCSGLWSVSAAMRKSRPEENKKTVE
jgi:hypothetical protein